MVSLMPVPLSFRANTVACRKIAKIWDTLVADGWKPSDAILEVREACGKVEE